MCFYKLGVLTSDGEIVVVLIVGMISVLKISVYFTDVVTFNEKRLNYQNITTSNIFFCYKQLLPTFPVKLIRGFDTLRLLTFVIPMINVIFSFLI